MDLVQAIPAWLFWPWIIFVFVSAVLQLCEGIKEILRRKASK
jgi:hypothetical protein